MTVGFWAPLPPERSGVADHAASLLDALRLRVRVEVAPQRADIHVYHLGNNQLHARIYGQALREPGVIVLHDAVLHHFALGFFERDAYIEEFVYNYGSWARDLANELWTGRARSAADPRYYEYAMLRRIVESSRAVIVHNRAAARIVRAHSSGARVFEIPLLFPASDLPDAAEVQASRAALSIEPGDVLCGVFGHLRESKRIMTVLRVFERLRTPLLLAGPCAPDLARAIEPYLASSHIRRIGYMPHREFVRLSAATDICINLRFPAAGETSAITIQMMGFGKPVVVTDGLEVAAFPAASCIRIEHGTGEEDQLEDLLSWLVQCRDDARAIGACAAAHINAQHSAERVGALYEEALGAVLD
jgi:glycosyltransferase involved in cell wall biosynthesis